MNRSLRLLLLLAVVAAVGGASSFLTARLVAGSARPAPAGESDVCTWACAQLQLTPEVTKAIGVVRARYAPRRSAINAHLRTANVALGSAVQEEGAWSPRVAAALEDIQRAQGELQKVTVEQLFELKSAVAPGQYQRLLRACSETLGQNCDDCDGKGTACETPAKSQ